MGDENCSAGGGGGAITIDGNDLTFAAVAPALEKLDGQIAATRDSQKLLNQNVEVLSEFLHELNSSDEPYDLISYELKLMDCKKRIVTTGTQLGNIHDRLSKLQRQIAREVYKKKQLVKTQPAPSAPGL
ncbi:unnamed protein product, partial [Mesorhabditis spiculigera]